MQKNRLDKDLWQNDYKDFADIGNLNYTLSIEGGPSFLKNIYSDGFFFKYVENKISRPFPTYSDHIDLSRPHRPSPTGRCWPNLDGVICEGGPK